MGDQRKRGTKNRSLLKSGKQVIDQNVLNSTNWEQHVNSLFQIQIVLNRHCFTTFCSISRTEVFDKSLSSTDLLSKGSPGQYLNLVSTCEMLSLRLQLHGAIYRPDSFVLMLSYCVNLKAIRYESTSLNRIVADKSHRVIVASSYNYTMRFIGYDSIQTRWFISYRFQTYTIT